MYKMEPIPAMDSNSDRPLKKLFLAYYLNNDYKKCDEIFNQIEEHDFQDWFIYMHIKTKQNIDYIKESWYEMGFEKFKDLNWKDEISLFHLNDKELNACNELIKKIKSKIENDDNLVEGFNIGTNAGSVAGQTIMHCHIHLIPRRKGDVENPQGGVRGVIPLKQHYLRKSK